MTYSYSLDLQPAKSSPLAKTVWNCSDLPAISGQGRNAKAFGQVLRAHDPGLSWLDNVEEELLLRPRTKRKKKQQRKRSVSLGRVKDLKIEAGVFNFPDEIENASTGPTSVTATGLNHVGLDATGAGGDVDRVSESVKDPQHMNQTSAAVAHGTSFLVGSTEPVAKVEGWNGRGEAMEVYVRARKRSNFVSDSVKRRRRRYYTDFTSD